MNRHRRGSILLETVIGLMLMGLLAGVLGLCFVPVERTVKKAVRAAAQMQDCDTLSLWAELKADLLCLSPENASFRGAPDQMTFISCRAPAATAPDEVPLRISYSVSGTSVVRAYGPDGSQKNTLERLLRRPGAMMAFAYLGPEGWVESWPEKNKPPRAVRLSLSGSGDAPRQIIVTLP